MILRYILCWFILLIVAMFNGVIREKVYKESLGELTAHQVSTLTGIVLFGITIWGLSKLWPLESSRQAWAIGLICLMMTVAFEFLFFHYVTGNSWSELLNNYNIFEGKVWVLVLLWTLIAPYVFWRVQQ
ncbi:MAG: hypothetical protein HW407_2355 [Bacteroidetes bacterium]|nr:hypothetical protein [Bacteroidota bacterium]